MLDHRLESLESRSLLSTTLLNGMPAGDGGANAQAEVMNERPWGSNDDDMYSFRKAAADDAVYEDGEDGDGASETSDVADDAGWSLVLDQAGYDDTNPWIGLSDNAAEQIDAGLADQSAADEGMAGAVGVAHLPADPPPPQWVDAGGSGDDTDESWVDPSVNGNSPDEPGVQFDFGADSGGASYTDLLL